MKPGDLVVPITHILYLYEGIRDGENAYENGHELHAGEPAVVVETYHGIGNHTYHFVLTPRGSTGWIHEMRVKAVNETR